MKLFPALVLFATLALSGVTARADAEDRAHAGLPAEVVPPELADVGVTEHLGESIPTDVRLRDEDGKDVYVRDFVRGERPVIVNFVYHSCPTLCTFVQSGFSASINEVPWTIGKDFDVLTISIDPRDTPAIASEKKVRWVKAYGRDEATTARGWHFLTGDERELKRLAGAIGFNYHFDAKQQQFAHSAAIFVLTPTGKLARYLYGIEFPAKDVRLALAEAAEGRSISTVDHFLLYCYKYDPNARGYVVVAWRVMRLGAAFSVVAIAAFLGLMWRRDRNKSRASAVSSVLPPSPPGPPGPPGEPHPHAQGLAVSLEPQSQFFLPHAGTALAEEVDTLYVFINWLSLAMFLLIVGAASYWVWKHRRKPGDELKLSSPTIHSPIIEIFWSVGPLLICLGLFHWGVVQYFNLRVVPAGAVDVRVRGRKWAWEFEYANGKVSNELHAPQNKPVRLVMTSQDVIHSFYIPDFRVKQDVIPGRYSTVWFEARELGRNQVFCAEYCGLSHSDMMTKVVVETQKDFQDWLDKDEDQGIPLAEVGKKVYEGKACNTCHSLDGSAKTGPSFKGLWGRQETMSDGTVVTVDENYVRESILQPQAKLVKGYQPVMPTFQGSLKEKQIAGIIEFLKAQK